MIKLNEKYLKTRDKYFVKIDQDVDIGTAGGSFADWHTKAHLPEPTLPTKPISDPPATQTLTLYFPIFHNIP